MFEVFKEQSYARAKYSTAVLKCFGRMTRLSGCAHYSYCIGAYCFVGASTVATFVGKMGVASGDIGEKAIYS